MVAAGQLGLPAAQVVRGQARALLAEAAAGLARLGVPDDPDALHDARVALRRLRSWLRAFAPEVEVPGAVDRRLRRMARATGAARDLEVAHERLLELALRARGARRAALRRLARELAARRDAERAALDVEVARRWRRLRPALERALRDGPTAAAPRFATLVAGRLAVAAAPLRRPPPSAADPAALHRLRIAGKRARYLLEPLRDAEPAAARALHALKALQEHLGAVNDAVVLEALLVEHAADAARRAVRGGDGAGRTLRDVAVAVGATRAWRRQLAAGHRAAVTRRLARLRHALATVVGALRSRRGVLVRGEARRA